MAIEIFAYCTALQTSSPEFPHKQITVRDYSTPGFADHLVGLVQDLFATADGQISQSLYAVCRHIQRTNVIVTFSVDGEHVEAIAPWAWKNNALLFLPDRSIRDPNGARLYDPDSSEPDELAQIPFVPDARQRKAQSELLLRNRLIDTPETLPPVVSELEVVLRPPDEVAWRMLALFIVAVRAESLATNNPIPVETLKQKSPLAFQAFTPWETQFMQSESPDQADTNAAGWRYEALACLQWAAGMQTSLPFADAICDVPEVARRMMANPGRELIDQVKLRLTSEILDQLDLNYRLLWSARNATINSGDPPAGLDAGVVTERQYALNWLTCFENADWDDVDIPS